MTYLAFLQALLALGPKLPAIMALIQHIVSDVQEIVSLLSPGPFAAAAPAFVAGREEEVAEAQVVAELSADASKKELKAIGDGTFLRLIWAFMQAHPELLTLLLSLFAKKA